MKNGDLNHRPLTWCYILAEHVGHTLSERVLWHHRDKLCARKYFRDGVECERVDHHRTRVCRAPVGRLVSEWSELQRLQCLQTRHVVSLG